MAMFPYRDDVLKHIKRSLRGTKNQWHVISFNYSGYHVAAKCQGNWVQRVYATELDNEGNQSVALRDNQEIILQDASPMDIRQKACVEFFESFLDCLFEIRSEERSK